MEDGKIVLSLFNGMGCLFYALEANGIKVKTAYSSEIEKHPNQANDLIFPNTIQLGDVRNVKGSDLGWIDILAGGSPCQSFSFAGKRKGMSTTDNVEILTLKHYLQLKEQNFEFEGQSYLFWEYMRIYHELKAINPNIKFLLENVIMGSKWQKILTQAIGINPIRINASLVSAQNRDRLFWTNIHTEQDGLFGDIKCVIPQPKDRGILFKDVFETFETSNFATLEEFDKYMEKYFLSDKMMKWLKSHSDKSKEKGNGFNFKTKEDNEKSNCINSRIHKMGVDDNYIVHNTMPRSSKTGKGGIAPCLSTDSRPPAILIQTEVFGADFRTDEGLRIRKNGKSGTLAARARNDESCGQLVLTNEIHQIKLGKSEKFHREKTDSKSYCIDTNGQDGIVINKTIRRLTPREAFRLQTVPEDKINLLLKSGISDTQLYKMAGNGWCINVVSHIFYFYNK